MIQRTIFLPLFAFAVSVFCSQSAFAEPGLAERRAMKEFQNGKYQQIEKDIDSAAGYDIVLNIEWDRLAKLGDAESYNNDDYFMNTIFLPLVEAVKQVGKDEMGKNALKSGLKSVHIIYDESTAVALALDDGLQFQNGTLTINFAPGVNVDGPGQHYFQERVAAIVKVLESKL